MLRPHPRWAGGRKLGFNNWKRTRSGGIISAGIERLLIYIWTLIEDTDKLGDPDEIQGYSPDETRVDDDDGLNW
ncbi:hypothetical protein NDU88_002662 [Pleurodeles waltl]|uniref:Uncharacterized protein n=1 Tax=Pleurodeles waltl TaxID=8319 RepID=A0AAV7KTA5_PLEWA|nr:hypothetical protein NDU88_002662 [Pleurodeles waltl]